MPAELAWFKSSHSGDEGGNCVEVATCPHAIHVRDSKMPNSPVLSLAPATWRNLTHHVSADTRT
nr:DUF397 domain-containing protein [Streptomyces xiaopingdaonensis]